MNSSSMMQFDGIAAIFAVIAIVSLLAGYKLLANSSWVGGWLRGNFGIFFVLLTGLFTLCVLDVRSYKPMFDEKTVATVSFRETSPRHYEARIVDAMGIENRYSISGDSWYVSANQFKWSKRLSLGMGHGYRFNKIIGSYENITGAESADIISRSRYFDVWKAINSYFSNNFLVSTEIVITVPEPLADAAMYEIVPSGFDLVVKPLNEFAKRAQLAAAQAGASTSEVISAPDLQPAPAAVSPDVSAPVTIPAAEVIPAVQDKSVTTQ